MADIEQIKQELTGLAWEELQEVFEWLAELLDAQYEIPFLPEEDS